MRQDVWLRIWSSLNLHFNLFAPGKEKVLNHFEGLTLSAVLDKGSDVLFDQVIVCDCKPRCISGHEIGNDVQSLETQRASGIAGCWIVTGKDLTQELCEFIDDQQINWPRFTRESWQQSNNKMKLTVLI